MRTKIRHLLLLGLASITSGCATTKLDGTLSNGVYTSASGDFALVPLVDLTAGGDGRIDDAPDGVTFTHLLDRHIRIYCLPFPASNYAADASGMGRFIDSYYTPRLSRISDAYLPQLQTGTALLIYAHPTDTEENPRKLGLAGFADEGRAFVVEVNIPQAAIFLHKGSWSRTEQIDYLKTNLVEVVKTMTIHPRTY